MTKPNGVTPGSIACPRCEAAAGRYCIEERYNWHGSYHQTQPWYHAERVDAAFVAMWAAASETFRHW